MTVAVCSYAAGGVVVGVVVDVAVDVVVGVAAGVAAGVDVDVGAAGVVAAVDGGEAMTTAEDSCESVDGEVPTADAGLGVGCVDQGGEIS